MLITRKISYIILSLVLISSILAGIFLNHQKQISQAVAESANPSFVSQETLKALPKGQYVNFKAEDIEKKQISKLVVHDASSLQKEIENGKGIVSKKDIADANTTALTFDSPQSAQTFLDSTQGKVANSDIEEDIEFKVSSYNDPYYSSQTNLSKMEMATGWRYLNNTSGTIIAVVDTGVRGTHEDLNGKVLAGYNFVSDVAISANANSDNNGHGTQMASAAAAIGNNHKGIVGVAYRSNILPVKSFGSNGTGLSSDIAAGIRWAASHRARIINMSFGSSTYSKAIHDALLYAKGKNCLLVAAAGNSGRWLTYPASDGLTLSAGSVNSSGHRSSFSNYGGELDVMAYGEKVRTASSSSNSAYTTSTGTSVACAQISGIAALAVNWHKGASTNQNMQYIRDSAKKVSGLGGANNNIYYGYGVANYNRLQTKVGDYQYSFVYQNGYPTLSSNGKYNFILRLRNTGDSTWRGGIVNLGTSHATDRVSGFLREGGNPSGWISANRIAFSQTSVVPGATATYSFWMQNNGRGQGTYNEYFQPVVNGRGWLPDRGIYWAVSVAPPTPAYDYSFVSQNRYPVLSRRGSYKFVVRIKNTGTKTWRKNKVNLGTSHGTDRVSAFIREGGNPSGWISSNRVAFKESSVARNHIATYEFYMKVPSNMSSGVYREYFQPVADGIGWMRDIGIYWRVRVR